MYIYIAPYCVCNYVDIYMYTIDGGRNAENRTMAIKVRVITDNCL